MHCRIAKELSLLSIALCLGIIVSTNINAMPVQLSGTGPDNEIVEISSSQAFLTSPDGKQMIYQAGPVRNSALRLYSVLLTGEEPAIELTTTSTGGAFDYKISPDSKYVVFKSASGYYSVPINGGAPVKLNTRFANDQKFEISPDSSTVVILDFIRLWSIPIAGGVNIDIAPTQPVPSQDITDFKIDPNSRYVVYPFVQNSGSSAGNPLSSHLNRVAIDGMEPAVDLLDGANDLESIVSFSFSPDGSRVVYSILTQADFVFAINSVSIDGGTTARLSGAPMANTNAVGPRISRDGETVYFEIADFGIGGVNRVLSAPINGGLITEHINLDSDLINAGRLLKESSQYLFIKRNRFTGLQEVLLKDLSEDTEAISLLANISPDESLRTLSVAPMENSAAIHFEKPNVVAGTSIHKVIGLNILDKTSTTVFEEESADQVFYSREGTLLIDQSGLQVLLEDNNASPTGVSGLKAVSLVDGEIFQLSDATANGSLVLLHGLTVDGSKAIYAAGEESTGTNANYFIVDLKGLGNNSAIPDEACFTVLTKDKKTVSFCL